MSQNLTGSGRIWSVAAVGLAALLLLAPARAAAQAVQIPGRVIDENGNPVPGLLVVLHQVLQGSGNSLAQATTDSTGHFRLDLSSEPSADGVYFVATRYHEELYVGQPFKPPFPENQEFTLQVGVPGTGITDAGMAVNSGSPSAPVSRPPRRWLLALIPVLGLLAITAYLLSRRPRLSSRRQLLIEIAELDEEHAAAGEGSDETYRRQRQQLLHMLTNEGAP